MQEDTVEKMRPKTVEEMTKEDWEELCTADENGPIWHDWVLVHTHSEGLHSWKRYECTRCKHGRTSWKDDNED
jgi:hypothetical protein